MSFKHRFVHPKDADGMANSVGPEQRSSLILVYMFAQICLARKLQSIAAIFYAPEVKKDLLL